MGTLFESQKISENYGENLTRMECTEYCFSDEEGSLKATSYTVFPGIEIVYHDIHTQKYSEKTESPGNIIEINHCREGRIEREFQKEFYYLSPGDLSIVQKTNIESSYFPMAHYHGISVLIHIDQAPKCLSCFLDDVRVSPQALAKKFCSEGRCFIVRSHIGIEHIFSELYNVPDNIKKGYFKIKILELLLFLSVMDLRENETGRRSVSKAQVTLAKSISAYLTEHMDTRIPIEQLSLHFHASGTQIKTCFKQVYGVSLYAYIRRQKMEAASLLIKDTDRSILEIAGRFGYNNGSKFSKAFKDIMGVTPAEYRSSHKKSIAFPNNRSQNTV